MAERSKAPDSSLACAASAYECSGLQLEAWVRIPLLTRFFYFYPMKERIPISRPTILRIIFEHLCAIDHLLPNSFLLEAANQRDAKKSSNENDDEEEDDDEEKIVLDPDKLLLLESLDHICCDVIDFIERITLAGMLQIHTSKL